MMLEDRVAAFVKLGKKLSAIDEGTLEEVAGKVRSENAWFTSQSVRAALNGLVKFLDEQKLEQWLKAYPLQNSEPKKVALVLAGNIPSVGFHDLLCVLIAGHQAMVKVSSKDAVLTLWLISQLKELEPRFDHAITISERLKSFDAVIATGSDNSARYFEFYFGKYPHIIRKNRTSCAILTGFESVSELEMLGEDVFTYFGLGCRNVSKLYVPVDYDFSPLLDSWSRYADIIHHHKYSNNYDYQKSIMLVNRVDFLDTGFVLLQENERLVSPISVVYYQYYKDWNSLLEILNSQKEKLQCIVGNAKPADVPIGQAQSPELWDYADKVDTMRFLTEL